MRIRVDFPLLRNIYFHVKKQLEVERIIRLDAVVLQVVFI